MIDKYKGSPLDSPLYKGYDPNVLTVKVESKTDEHGKADFTIIWFSPDFHSGPQWCGQVYRTVLDEFLKRHSGEKIKVIPFGQF